MGNPTESPSADAGGKNQSEAESRDGTTARQILLEEARTAANQQLSQVNKIDAAAVRTVRIAFLLIGILFGGSRFHLLPDLGTFGLLGTWSLVASLFGSLYVYGTARLFIGSGPEELDIDYEEAPTTEDTRVEVIKKYEAGISHNWSALYVNGFVLAISRVLLGLAVLFVILGIVRAT